MGKYSKFNPARLVHRVRIEYHDGGEEMISFSTESGAREFQIRTQKLTAVKTSSYLSPRDWENLNR